MKNRVESLRIENGDLFNRLEAADRTVEDLEETRLKLVAKIEYLKRVRGFAGDPATSNVSSNSVS